MIWTLHKYLLEDQVKTALLAAAALTLLMTTFAVIEPMRQQGLAPGQVLKLFWYILPVMLSLTLPIATLLAATMVYGRFSMDNELTACRASGVPPVSLLRPALWLAAVVSLLTLLLSNWIGPQLARQGEAVGRANLRGLLYQRLRAKGFVRYGHWLVHADRADPANNVLQGVVAADVADANNITYLVASRAHVYYADAPGGVTEITVNLINPSRGEQVGHDMVDMATVSIGPYEVRPFLREDPTFYDWETLSAIRQDPRRSSEVRRRWRKIERELHAQSLYDQIAEQIALGATYRELYDRQGRLYVLKAPAARRKSGSLLLTGEDETSQDRPVTVDVLSAAGDRELHVLCRTAEIHARYAQSLGEHTVGLTVTGAAVERAGTNEPVLKDQWSAGAIEMPKDIGQRLTGVDLTAAWNDPGAFPGVRDQIVKLKDHITNWLRLKIVAEMHGRIAYGAGCFALVAVGAALGLIYRGGNLLSAFALSCIPAAILVILMVMGKQMVSNPEVHLATGVTMIWAGVGVLAAMAAYLYGFALRGLSSR